MNNSSKIALAFAAGIAAGTLLGLLFAPGKGSETRDKINERATKLADNIKSEFSKAKKRFDGMKDEIFESES